MKKVLLFTTLILLYFISISQTIVLVSPDEATQGEELEITVTGENTLWMQGTNVLFFKQGSSTIYPSPQNIISNTEIKGYFYFNSGQQTGSYDVRVEDWSNGDVALLEDGFTLNEGLEGTITSVEPDSAHQVESLSVTITGENTNFLQGSTILKFTNYVESIYPYSQTINSNTELVGDFFISADHSVDDYDVIVTTTGGYISLEDGFHILEAEVLPELIDIDPDTAEQGETVLFTITGQDTHFNVPGITNTVYLLDGNNVLYSGNVTALSNTSLEAEFEFYYYHQPGNFDLFVSNQLDGSLSIESGITLEAGLYPPGITSVEPDTAMQTEEVWVTITGENVDFGQGSITVFLKQENGSIIYPNDQNIINDSIVEADFFFNPDQSLGFYDVNIAGSLAFLADGFFLLEPENYPGTPSNEPINGAQNEEVTLTIEVDYAHFNHPGLETSAVLLNRNQGIYPENITVIDSNTLKADFLFESSHTPGIYDLKLFNQLDGTLWKINAFTLEGDTTSPQIIEVNPDNANHGESLWVSISGQNTSFTTGSATIKFKQGSSTIIFPVDQVILSDTQIEGDFSFSDDDPSGYYDVFVYDLQGNWTVNKENGFYLGVIISVDEIENSRLGKVYPNPANEVLFIEREANNTKGMAIDILNLAGEIIHIDEMTSSQVIKKIDISGFESGVYLIQLRCSEKVIIEKFVIR